MSTSPASQPGRGRAARSGKPFSLPSVSPVSVSPVSVSPVSVALVTIALIGVLLLSACSVQTEPSTSETTEPVPVNPALERGSRVVLSVGALPETIDPLFPDSTVARWVLELTTWSLYDMISSHETDDGGRIHRIWPAQSEFHTGEAVSLSDIKYGYDRLLEVAGYGAYREFASKLIEVEIDRDHLIFTFNRPVRLEDQGFRLPVVRAFSVEEGRYVGSGQYEWVESADGLMVLERRSRRDDESDAPVDRMEFVDLTYQEGKRALTEGRIDVLRMPRDRAEGNWAKKQDWLQLAVRESDTMYYIGFSGNLMQYPGELRQAIARSIDFAAFFEQAFDGYAHTLSYPVVSIEERRQAQLLPSAAVNRSLIDPALTALNWARGDSGYYELEDTIFTIRYAAFVDVDWSYLLADYVKSALQPLGIRVEIQYLDYNTMMTMLNAGTQFDMWGFAWQLPRFATPEALFSSGEAGIYNYGGFSDESADQLFQMLYQSERGSWSQYYEAWYAICAREMPVIPIGYPDDVWIANERIRLSELPLIRLHR